MDSKRVKLTNFASRIPLTGSEIPANKQIKSTQIHRDYFPLRAAAGECLSSNSPPPACYRYTPVDSRAEAVHSQRPVSPILRNEHTHHHSITMQQAGLVTTAKPLLKQPTFRTEIRSRFHEFSPYTLREYRELKPSFSQVLGGLGPVRVGTEAWRKGVRRLLRIRQFSDSLRRSHTTDP